MQRVTTKHPQAGEHVDRRSGVHARRVIQTTPIATTNVPVTAAEREYGVRSSVHNSVVGRERVDADRSIAGTRTTSMPLTINAVDPLVSVQVP